jgi:hypothetical protein
MFAVLSESINNAQYYLVSGISIDLASGEQRLINQFPSPGHVDTSGVLDLCNKLLTANTFPPQTYDPVQYNTLSMLLQYACNPIASSDGVGVGVGALVTFNYRTGGMLFGPPLGSTVGNVYRSFVYENACAH